ncbi:hypothetical protein BDY21DRAFT_331122 [Lineolata rhizophorae]|uniref:Uncharacterized protein n=1 Tax=Lineolata rhizophorae TaxID=578093 RepID=A0A6A6PEA8_9PEZI|nr:hypothetical protein BDY21DRAFT_331122 [Lineolata rhizophorae]
MVNWKPSGQRPLGWLQACCSLALAVDPSNARSSSGHPQENWICSDFCDLVATS